MTTVVFHKGVLAADTRTTLSSREHQCPECGYHGFAVLNNTEKVRLPRFSSQKFRGERIAAVAGAGVAPDIAQAIKLLSHENIQQVYDNVFEFCNAGSGIPGARTKLGVNFRLMIVTEKSLYFFQAWTAAGKVKVDRYELDSTVCMGSGASAARLALMMFGCTAPQAVKAAMIADVSTGGRVSWVDTTQEKKAIHVEQLHAGDLQKVAESMQLNVQSIRLIRPRTKELPPPPPPPAAVTEEVKKPKKISKPRKPAAKPAAST